MPPSQAADNRPLKNSFATLASTAKAAGERKLLIAALKRCATQNQGNVDFCSKPADRPRGNRA